MEMAGGLEASSWERLSAAIITSAAKEFRIFSIYVAQFE
jgi:hypothetical protein